MGNQASKRRQSEGIYTSSSGRQTSAYGQQPQSPSTRSRRGYQRTVGESGGYGGTSGYGTSGYGTSDYGPTGYGTSRYGPGAGGYGAGAQQPWEQTMQQPRTSYLAGGYQPSGAESGGFAGGQQPQYFEESSGGYQRPVYGEYQPAAGGQQLAYPSALSQQQQPIVTQQRGLPEYGYEKPPSAFRGRWDKMMGSMESGAGRVFKRGDWQQRGVERRDLGQYQVAAAKRPSNVLLARRVPEEMGPSYGGGPSYGVSPSYSAGYYGEEPSYATSYGAGPSYGPSSGGYGRGSSYGAGQFEPTSVVAGPSYIATTSFEQPQSRQLFGISALPVVPLSSAQLESISGGPSMATSSRLVQPEQEFQGTSQMMPAQEYQREGGAEYSRWTTEEPQQIASAGTTSSQSFGGQQGQSQSPVVVEYESISVMGTPEQLQQAVQQ